MSTTCIHCGAPLNRPSAKFCTTCGKAQPAAEPAAVAASAQSPIAAAIASIPAPPTVQDGIQSASPPAQPTLVIQDEGQVREVPLGTATLTIGRAPSNDIVLTSRFVSARHARVEPSGATYVIIDTGSTNGILAEGKRLDPNTPLTLADGDVLRIGDPATGNFVTLTYHNPAAARVAQAAIVAHSYPLDPSDPHLSHGKRFYRPNKGEVGRTLKHFAQCTSIGRKDCFFCRG